jgi:HSP20 family protein
MLPALNRKSTAVMNQPLNTVRNELEAMRDYMNQIFDPWFAPSINSDGDLVASYPVDLYEDDGKILVDAELPGFKKKEIDISVENGALRISAERKQKKHNGKSHVRERQYERVERLFALPTGVDDSKANATFEDGVLHLELPKSEEAKSHCIKIN